jgi:hypothetical protein
MSFLDCYNALYEVLRNNATLTNYVHATQFLRGFRENFPYQDYSLILEPDVEATILNTKQYGQVPAPYRNKSEVMYVVNVFCRVILTISNEANIIGGTQLDVFKRGILEFTRDVRHAVRLVPDLNYNRVASSTSKANVSSTFALSSSKKYLSVSINGRTPVGYNSINCGGSSLSGSSIATNIQASLRLLGKHADDGYKNAVCTYNDVTKKFVISSNGYDPDNCVVVTAGSSNDCSAILGFDAPTEVAGRNITKVEFGTIVADNVAYPVRYRVVPVQIYEVTLD